MSWLFRMLRRRFDHSIKQIRVRRLCYMLIFPLAPMFANMQGQILAGQPTFMGLDAMSLMGAMYCMGAGLLFAFSRLDTLHRYARTLSLISAVFYAAWIAIPQNTLSLFAAMMFAFAYGGCSGIAAFAFSYALNDSERLLGTALTSLFCMLWQLDFSFQFISGLYPHAYLTALVLGTLICLHLYRSEDYACVKDNRHGRFNLPLILMLFFFLAHKMVEIFYTYLPVSSSFSASRANALVGMAVFVISVFLYFGAKFSIWHLYTLFFLGMIASITLANWGPAPWGWPLARYLHGFEQIGFIVSYYLLGSVLRRYAGFSLYKWVIMVALSLSVLSYMVPGLIAARYPAVVPILVWATATGLFLMFIFLAPSFSGSNTPFRRRSQADSATPLPAKPSGPVAFMEEKGLTQREQEIAVLLLQGLPLKECAGRLVISLDTVKFHVKNIYRKLGVSSRSQLFSAMYDVEFPK